MEAMEANEFSKPRTSGAAIASLVCGLLFCIPFVTGLAAVILGIVGIRGTGNRMVTGRGMAIAGLILGLLSLGAWTAGSGTIAALVYGLVEKVTPAQEFTKAVSEGKIDAAMSLSVEGTDRAALTALSEKMKPWGTFQLLMATSNSSETINETTRVTLAGSASFANGSKNFSITLLKVGDGYKVEKYDFK